MMPRPRFAAFTFALALFCLLMPVVAAAQECAARSNIVLYMAFDVSESMEGNLGEAADFGVGLIDALRNTGFLRSAGAFAFSHELRGEVPITPEIRTLRRDVDNSIRRAGAEGNTALYDAIVLGSEIIYAQDPDNIRVFMVLTDGADVSSRHTLLHAHNALGPGVLTELIYIGAPGDDGEANLEAISGDPQSGHVRARTSSPEDLGDLVAGIVDRTCGNWAPFARIALDPSPLQLGRPGFEMELDARGSSDTEDDDELTFHELTYQWTMLRGGERRRAQGPHPIVQFSDADIGDWSVDLTVTDSGNASAPASDSFAVVGAPPT